VNTIKRKFFLRRWFGKVSISIEKEKKGFNTTESWFRTVQIENITKSDIESITTHIQEENLSLAATIMKH
jgi:hypothetical protein